MMNRFKPSDYPNRKDNQTSTIQIYIYTDTKNACTRSVLKREREMKTQWACLLYLLDMFFISYVRNQHGVADQRWYVSIKFSRFNELLAKNFLLNVFQIMIEWSKFRMCPLYICFSIFLSMCVFLVICTRFACFTLTNRNKNVRFRWQTCWITCMPLMWVCVISVTSEFVWFNLSHACIFCFRILFCQLFFLLHLRYIH